ncbi:MAG: hypothetical protein UX85_C0003G0180 [Candidatus Beckwithbacteria bacterium GW2011_GWB1_47_15]|uniref:L-threonylcarbamoyladenylate synthase n=1 Tax=Candidatus Beckwithbacteria bacterium GW2011_GWB1_47_15 TaxID=1618371 RepID=A0A0G1RWM5_9BACT|nr:MAG: hypothetical protein UY43_C0001G0280 [Candidatus Beckwithbacteria bacterium GW2011_GWC1_49_16]KKU35201.1 MAG: hypothetical protein UX50_C0005G0024 [Candidatus Beckwithbacteria bacterium GW2011_GWA1_46_30]KKU61521.1 MAG: hypothetical protein UX85_C0003G0180 [Candidatus Beckwithbacteria bacterium GW2011_GWB1_47_15]KKU71725.1 MAG: hypothetical protein UX97_C0004G0048 [Candidatus Beckwithbacteria bacterium GW2011_GWA2_47_25]KKW03823.1 MAG: hypothetical protein UY37_C0004G0116 [Candidatus Be
MEITQAVKVLKAHGLVIYPTETCYGAGVDATSKKAVAKLLAYKSRREGKPLSVAVADQTMASKYVKLNTSAKNLYRKFLPGPLTVVSWGRGKVAPGVESETGTLGIRIPDHPVALALAGRLGRPITATSANVSYKPKPYSISQLLKHTSRKQQSLIDFIIDVGKLPRRPASTVVDTTLDDPLILREGKIKLLHSRSEKFPHSGSAESVTTHSPQETSDLAQKLMLAHWNDLQKKPLLFLLIGDLGSGKTQFAKGIGRFLKIPQTIVSPTYTIEREYPFRRYKVFGKFLHLDTWRLSHIEEFYQLHLEDRLKTKTVAAVEWAGRTLKPLLTLAQKSRARVVLVNLKTPPHQKAARDITISTPKTNR